HPRRPLYPRSFPTRRSSDLGDLVRLGRGAHPGSHHADVIARANGAIGPHEPVEGKACQGGIGFGPPRIVAVADRQLGQPVLEVADRKSTRLNSSHEWSSYAV